jgi:hypothetical protein
VTQDQQIDTAPGQQKALIGKAQSTSHVLQRAIVVERVRVMFTPVPKAGCTSVLWSLAELARLQEKHFAESAGREVTRALAIHDLGRWPDPFRFGERSAEEREEILKSEKWLRFTVVRHPFRRLWSAWQSKILLAEPQFIARYSEEPWWPGPARSASDVLKAFRQFMDALRADPELVRADVHWAPQVAVVEHPSITYSHIGQVEEMSATLDAVREHLRSFKAAEFTEPARANVSSMPYANELFTEEDVRFLSEMYADDMNDFGYEPPPGDSLGGTPPASWMAVADAVTPALEELRLRHERVADLQLLLKGREQKAREAERSRKREKVLRREEHRRNQRLQKRLRKTTVNLQQMRNSRTWRYTAPLRKAGQQMRRLLRRR